MTRPVDNALTCKEFVELVTDYLEGALIEAARARTEAHLATCEGCTTYLDQMRETVRLLRRLAQLAPLDGAAPGAEAREALLRHFREHAGA